MVLRPWPLRVEYPADQSSMAVSGIDARKLIHVVAKAASRVVVLMNPQPSSRGVLAVGAGVKRPRDLILSDQLCVMTRPISKATDTYAV